MKTVTSSITTDKELLELKRNTTLHLCTNLQYYFTCKCGRMFYLETHKVMFAVLLL